MDTLVAGTPNRVIGYHGTSLPNARRIIQEGFRPSTNPYDWLGAGTYFFDSAPGRALAWARHNVGRDAAVLRAEIDLSGALDLLDSTEMSLLREYASVIDLAGMPLRQGAGRNEKDCYLINAICEALEAQNGAPVTAVRAAFREGAPIFPDSEIFDLSHVQIVVRDRMCISGVMLDANA